VDTTVPKSPDIPEPPPGSVVLDRDGVAWQHRRKDAGWSWWFSTAYPMGVEYAVLVERHGPLTVVYAPSYVVPGGLGEMPLPVPAVYVIEQRTNLAAGGHAFQLLPAGFAYPSIPNAQAAVEHMAGDMVWREGMAFQPGDRLPLYRIVEVPLANTQGGA
jgi:hypothetical protein